MKEYVVDLQSFIVEANSLEEAMTKAVKMLESGEERAVVDQVMES